MDGGNDTIQFIRGCFQFSLLIFTGHQELIERKCGRAGRAILYCSTSITQLSRMDQSISIDKNRMWMRLNTVYYTNKMCHVKVTLQRQQLQEVSNTIL